MLLFLKYFPFFCIENLYYLNVPMMQTGKIQKIKVYRRKCKEFHIVVLSDTDSAMF